MNRNFTADRPDVLWVTDLTYVPTRSAMAYVCFIIDVYARRIVGWTAASNMKTQTVLDALEMARRSRGSKRLVGLVTHSDYAEVDVQPRIRALACVGAGW